MVDLALKPSCLAPNSPRIYRHMTFLKNEESNHYALIFFKCISSSRKRGLWSSTFVP
jgi:hypothetical protein